MKKMVVVVLVALGALVTAGSASATTLASISTRVSRVEAHLRATDGRVAKVTARVTRVERKANANATAVAAAQADVNDVATWLDACLSSALGVTIGAGGELIVEPDFNSAAGFIAVVNPDCLAPNAVSKNGVTLSPSLPTVQVKRK